MDTIPSSLFAFLRRAVPTVALLVGASALLLLTDRQSAKRALPAIAVLQQTSSMVLEDAVKGMIAGLAERGYRGFSEPYSTHSANRFKSRDAAANAKSFG